MKRTPDPRQDRLAAALRENLKRRKAKVRGPAQRDDDGAGKPDAAPDKTKSSD
jgi:hypothetical protein